MSTSPPTNLPDPSYTGPLTCYVSREIDAPLETVWEILSDFTQYPDWSVLFIAVLRIRGVSRVVGFRQESVRVRRSLAIRYSARNITLLHRRSQQITDQTGKTVLTDQTPAAGKYLLMKTHIPPTLDDSARLQDAFELIIAYDDDQHRMAWQSLLPQWIVKAERWQALSTTADGKTFYESREIFAGFGAYLIKWFISTPLTQSFEAMADAIQTRAEAQ